MIARVCYPLLALGIAALFCFTSPRWGVLLNATAIGLFLLATVTCAVLARLQRARASAPTPFQQPIGVGRRAPRPPPSPPPKC